jgi:hypothetical protein
MPRIIIKAHTPNSILGAVTLKERVVSTEQQNGHYIPQLIERVGWALIDAEQLESQTNNSHPDGPTRANTHLTSPPGCSDARPRETPARTYAAAHRGAGIEMSSDHTRDAARDLALADRLGRLLRDVADRAPEIDVDAISEEDWVQDHLVISDVEPGRIWFEGGVGPIAVPYQVSDLARPGCSAFVTAARTAGSWELLQVGFVYP